MCCVLPSACVTGSDHRHAHLRVHPLRVADSVVDRSEWRDGAAGRSARFDCVAAVPEPPADAAATVHGGRRHADSGGCGALSSRPIVQAASRYASGPHCWRRTDLCDQRRHCASLVVNACRQLCMRLQWLGRSRLCMSYNSGRFFSCPAGHRVASVGQPGCTLLASHTLSLVCLTFSTSSDSVTGVVLSPSARSSSILSRA